MNKVELFNQTEKEIKELETVLKVLDSALEKEKLDKSIEIMKDLDMHSVSTRKK